MQPQGILLRQFFQIGWLTTWLEFRDALGNGEHRKNARSATALRLLTRSCVRFHSNHFAGGFSLGAHGVTLGPAGLFCEEHVCIALASLVGWRFLLGSCAELAVLGLCSDLSSGQPIFAVIEMLKDSTSHNLWPFEFLIYAALSLVPLLGVSAAWLIGRLFKMTKQTRE